MTAQNRSFRLTGKGTVVHAGREYRLYAGPALQGPRFTIDRESCDFPQSLRDIPHPPNALYLVGDPAGLEEGLAVIGARKATPYGLSCARHFAEIAALKGIAIVSGGAYGCDSQAHRGALDAGGKTVVFLGGGCDQIYPSSHYRLFQDVIDGGGAVVSEHPWDYPALPFTFRQRNRLIAGCAKAVLIVEAGLPSGTFSTADEALSANKDVLVVPGAISSYTSAGSNRLLYQGATPVVDDESFEDQLYSLFGVLRSPAIDGKCRSGVRDHLLEALRAQPMSMERIYEEVPVPKKARNPGSWHAMRLAQLEADGAIERYPDGRYGPSRIA